MPTFTKPQEDAPKNVRHSCILSVALASARRGEVMTHIPFSLDPPPLSRTIEALSSIRVPQAHSSSIFFHPHTSFVPTPSTMVPVIKTGIYTIKSVGHITQVVDHNAADQGSVFPISHSLRGIHVCSPHSAVGEKERHIPRQEVRVGAMNFGLETEPINSSLYSGSSRITAGTFAPSRTL